MRLIAVLAAGLALALGLAEARTLLGSAMVPKGLPPAVPASSEQAAPNAPATGTGALSATPPPSVAASRMQALRELLDAVLARAPLATAQAGVHVTSLDTGEVIYARDADRPLNPASNVKLVTSAAALARLGPEFRFRTDFSCRPALGPDGYCETLHVVGRGDPSLTTERMWGIVGELSHAGVRKVGDIAVDDAYFDESTEGPGYEQEKRDRPYMAPSGALSVNHNTVGIYVSSEGEGRRAKTHVALEPMSDYFVVENKVEAAPRKARMRLSPSSIAAGDRQRIRVSGRLPAGKPVQTFYRKVDNPALYAGETLKALLGVRGVVVRGKVRRSAVPADARLVHSSRSPALAEMVRELNKTSNNFDAEMLLRVLGAEASGAPGTWPKGVAAVESFLAEAGLPAGSYVLKNGSGLNDTNRFSAAQLTRLLTYVARRTTYFPEYASSLGIAGRDGTLRLRMDGTAAEGRLRGKTGTLSDTTALSGYVKLASDETWAYSILVNDTGAKRRRLVASVDLLATHIASGGLKPADAMPDAPRPEGEAVAEIARLAAQETASAEVIHDQRVALGRERDPAVRAAMADALYRWEADGAAGLVLEQLPTDPAAFGRLRTLALSAHVAVPTLSPLWDLAAAGDDEALDKALVLAPIAGQDVSTAALFEGGFGEAGRNAAGELFEALKRATDAGRASATVLLERAVSASEERRDHPLVKHLDGLRADSSNELARRLHDRLVKALEAHAAGR
jgi:D-alanyl-D-alanine carboxypeptidase/D-alanyl-D-alanine-endopeptidase (penicillin-binding protein 4)